MLLPAPAAAQEVPSCAELLTEGERSYLLGRFDEAIQRATNCLRQGDVPEATAVRALRLQALAHLKLDDLEAAKAAISNLLNLAPRYEPDPVQQPPAYISLVAIVKQERGPVEPLPEERPSWLRRNWGWVPGGGGLVLTGLVTLLVGSGGGGTGGGGGGGLEPLPPPPTPPGN